MGFLLRDLLTAVLAKSKPLDTPVGDYASGPLVTVPEGTSIHDAAVVMSKKHIRRLPVVRDKRLVGIVTARDLVEAYAK